MTATCSFPPYFTTPHSQATLKRKRCYAPGDDDDEPSTKRARPTATPSAFSILLEAVNQTEMMSMILKREASGVALATPLKKAPAHESTPPLSPTNSTASTAATESDGEDASGDAEDNDHACDELVERIIDAVANGFELPKEQLMSTSKKPIVHLARQLGWYLIMRHSTYTQTRAARHLGAKNHKSVSRAVQNWTEKRNRCDALDEMFPRRADASDFFASIVLLSTHIQQNFKSYLCSFTTTALRQRRGD